MSMKNPGAQRCVTHRVTNAVVEANSAGTAHVSAACARAMIKLA
jgi:hypothetical protein